jgi:hypothetical protein
MITDNSIAPHAHVICSASRGVPAGGLREDVVGNIYGCGVTSRYRSALLVSRAEVAV